jgi:replicative DNA helicase
MNNLNDEFFSDYTDEFNWIKEHVNKYGNCPDMTSFVSRFPDFDVIEVKETISYLVDELYTDRNRRKLAKIFNKVRQLLNEDKTEEAMTLYTNAASDIVKSNHIETVDILRNTSRYDDYVEKCNDFDKYYVRTGFKELDDLIGGWDRNEELATIVARPGVGKSWVLQKIAVAAAEQGLNVGLYSGEMSENKVGFRVDTLISHLSNSGIMKGKSEIQTEYKKYMEELPNKFKGSIKVLTPAMINGVAGVTALRAFVEKEHLDILCIDQHSLLDDDRKARNPVEKAANISRDLKNLQVIKGIPIIAVSQQNRDSVDNGLTTAHVSQSDRIAQDSTILIFIQQKDHVLTLNLVKSRDSGNGAKLQYAIDLDRGIFEYIADSQNEEQSEALRKEYECPTEEDVY